MAYNDLREWIAALENAGELKRIRAEVDPVLEITEIADRVSKGASIRNRPLAREPNHLPRPFVAFVGYIRTPTAE